MKLWMVHPRLDRRGGAENLLESLCQGLRDRHHDVSVATLRFDASAWPEGAWSGVRIARLGRLVDRVVPRRLRPRLRARRLGALVRGADYAIAHNFPAALWVARCVRPGDRTRRVWYCNEPSERLHWHTVFPRLVAAGEAGEAAYPWADGAFVRHLAHLRERRPRETALDRRLDLAAVESLDAVFGNSAFISKAAERVYGRSVRPCLPGIAPPAVAGHRRPEAKPYVAWVTNPRIAKNALGFLEALRLARERAPDLVVEALGLDAALRERATSLGLADALVAHDPLDDEGYASLLAGSRFVAYVSIEEPFGLVPIDAMAQGRAVLASSIGGPAETVVAGETGVHVDPFDPAAIAEAMVSLWNDPERCEGFGHAGRARYEREFTLERFLDRFEEALESVGQPA